MKLSFILLFIILILTFTYGQSVVPLSIGNKWIFNYTDNSGHYIESYQVVSDTLISNQQFKKIKSTYENQIDFEYWRADSVQFYVLNSVSFTSGIKYNSLIKKDTTFSTTFGEGIFVKLYEKDFLNIQNRKVQETSTTYRMLQHEWNSTYITALEIGPIEMKFDYIDEILQSSSNSSAIIIGAIIDGIVYGDTLTTSIKYRSNLTYSYNLLQNFPNPFNPSTKINYSIPKSEIVTFKIYNELGREIRTLVNEEKPAGTYTVEFNGNNLPSGVYFYQIQAGNFVKTKKMLLIK